MSELDRRECCSIKRMGGYECHRCDLDEPELLEQFKLRPTQASLLRRAMIYELDAVEAEALGACGNAADKNLAGAEIILIVATSCHAGAEVCSIMQVVRSSS